MLNKQLLNPESIVIIGASDNISKPGGKLLKNILEGLYKGKLYVLNPGSDSIQGVKSYRDQSELPDVDLAIIAIPAKSCPSMMEYLAKYKKTKAFIIISAGFSEENEEGKLLEDQLKSIANKYKASLIGPNCIGVLNQNYCGVFTTPVPRLDPRGCDFISGSGATAVFIMESGIPKGLTFNSVYSVGNSAQIGVENILEYLDEHFDPCTSSRVVLLYIEKIDNPDKLLKHSSSLIRKGVRIAAIKSGGSEAGSRAASSHTGAIATSDHVVDALFRKAGIVRCYGREELITVASVLHHKPFSGRNIAIITHAGGPAVMLTDALSIGGLGIPRIEGKAAEELLAMLHQGASVSNPIDLLATGTNEQLGKVIDYCDQKFDDADAMMVIFGSTGLTEIYDTYELLHQKMLSCRKPIFPILPSISSARKEVEFFLSKGHINFPDEVLLAKALTMVHFTPQPADEKIELEGVDVSAIRKTLEQSPNGYISNQTIRDLFHAANIPQVYEGVARNRKQLMQHVKSIGYPLVMKAVGPLHKSDVGGVVLNINTEKHLLAEYKRLMKISGTTSVLVQPMVSGIELFLGAKYEPRFGHLVICGLGGIFVEILQDVASGLAPLTYQEAFSMIRSIKSYKILEGARGQGGIDIDQFAQIIVRLSTLLRFATEIKEMDINPLIGSGKIITAVDARIRIEKNEC